LFDFKVTRSVDYDDNELSPQEEKTIKAIVDARYICIANLID
jgi:hypothetical protein